MSKVLKTVGMVVGGIALAVFAAPVLGGILAGLPVSASLGFAGAVGLAGISAGALFAASAGLMLGASLLAPKPKAPSVSPATNERLLLSADLRTGRKMILGSTAMATDLRDQEYTDDQSYVHRFVVSASHKARAIREIWFDDKKAWSSAGGVTSDYAGYLWVTPVLEGSAANAIYVSARMGYARRYTGCAYVYFKYKLTGNSKKSDSPFASSIPTRVTIIGDGIDVYDPRLDSTVSGGSGSHRADNQATWAWTDSQARNPALQMLVYLLGWRINGKLAIGKGIPPARIDLASFITAANLCDELVAKSSGGTEPRYRSDGIISENDDPAQVLDNLKATMNAVLDDVDGRIRLTVLHNDLAAPIGDLTADDVLGDFTWAQTVPLPDSVNIIRGGYVDPSTTSLYQMVDYPDVSIASPDGIDRPQTINFAFVQSASQAQRLAKQRLQRMLYGGTFTAVFQATAWRFQKGDVIRFSFFPLGWSNKLFRIADMAIQVDGTVPMMLREEHPDIYAWDASDAPAVVGAAPTTYDPSLWPLVQGITDLDDLVADIFDDGVITHGKEKRSLVLRWNALESQFQALDARYVALGSPSDLTAARTDAHDAYVALAATLAALTPDWDDVDSDTPVNGAALNAQWSTTQAKIDTFAAAITGRPGADGAPGPSGAGTFTLIANDGNVTVTPTSATKVGGGSAWNGGAYTTEKYAGDVMVTGRVVNSAHHQMIGLNADNSAGSGYDDIDYAAYNFGGTFNARVAGASMAEVGTVADGAILYVRRRGATIEYGVVGESAPRWTYSTGVDPTIPVGADIALFEVGSTVDRITFQPVGADGPGGEAGVVVAMTRASATVWAYADGSVIDWSPASGQVKVQAGGVDVTASATFSAATTAGMTGGITSGGAYSVTALTPVTGTMTITVTYAGKNYTLLFGVTKATGGYEIVTALPASNLFEGRVVYLTTDDKLYRYNGAAWTTSVPAADIAGTLADAQIAAVAASKVTGQMTDAQIASLAAAKLTGQIVNTQIVSLDATKVTGQLADSQIAAIGAAKLTGQITGTQITDGGISTAKLAAGAVTTAILAAGAVTTNELAANAVQAGNISAGAITTAKLAAGAVTANEIASNAITTAKLAAGAVTTSILAAGAVTANELASNSITAVKIAAGAIEAGKLAAGAVQAGNISAGAVTAGTLAAGVITATELATDAVTANKIAAGAVTAAKMSVTQLSAITATIGVLRTASTGQRTEIKDDVVEVYNASNVLQVQIGIWS